MVEDERVLRDLIALDLREEGALVEVAADGREALAIIERDPPDLLLLDLLMPHVDGFAVLQRLHERGCTFPVVVLSNLTSPEQEEQCTALGAREFIVKSDLATGDLWLRVRKYLQE